jgi:hypothetical protein
MQRYRQSPTVKTPQARQEPEYKNIRLIASKYVSIIHIRSETTIFPSPYTWFSGHCRPDRQFASLHARPEFICKATQSCRLFAVGCDEAANCALLQGFLYNLKKRLR